MFYLLFYLLMLMLTLCFGTNQNINSVFMILFIVLVVSSDTWPVLDFCECTTNRTMLTPFGKTIKFQRTTFLSQIQFRYFVTVACPLSYWQFNFSQTPPPSIHAHTLNQFNNVAFLWRSCGTLDALLCCWLSTSAHSHSKSLLHQTIFRRGIASLQTCSSTVACA